MRLVRIVLPAVLALLVLTSPVLAGDAQKVRLDGDWRFIRSDAQGAQAETFEDGTWEAVSLPHSWNAADWSAPNAGYYRGPGWYRRSLQIPASYAGKRVFVRFEAASIVAEVFVNGQRVGEHRGSFAAFCFEITRLVRPGAKNLLAVRVTNAKQNDVPPLDGDFNVFGGLYRPVTLMVREPLCVTPLDFGSPGVAVRQTHVDAERADLALTTKVSNEGTAARDIEVVARIEDSSGRTLVTDRHPASVAVHQTTAIDQTIQLAHPHLWNGLADPYLHRVVVEVRAGPTLLDQVVQPLGIRSIRFDKALGFFLNGKSYPIRGVNRHQDLEGHAWALTEQDQDADMALIREIGANGIRLAHYQHGDYFYSLCDRYGLVAWAEIPLVNIVTGKEPFDANATQQLVELIRQNMNHPSIVVWSLYNEISLRTTVDPTPLIRKLQPVAKGEDPTRPTVAATPGGHMLKYAEMTATPDLIAGNFYPGWYEGEVGELGAWLDRYNKAFDGRGIAVSEYGAGASIAHHEQGMTKAPPVRGRWHPEAWQAILHETQYAAIKARPSVWGSFVWAMFDFASATRSEGDRDAVNDKGLVTYDRRTRKDAFYFYKANWSAEVVLYIASRRHTVRTQAVTAVKVYSNAVRVELKVNGRVQAPVPASDVRVFLWKDVKLTPGENLVEATASAPDGTSLTDSCRWTYTPEEGASPAVGTASLPGVEVRRDIVFATPAAPAGAAQALTLDVYQPAGGPAGLRPAILWIHGGGFKPGTDKRQKYVVTLATEFTARGYVSVAADYRVREHPELDRIATLRDAVDDCRAALAWVRAHRDVYRIDDNRLVVAGGSAGGMIGFSLVALENAEAARANGRGIRAFVDLWGSPNEALKLAAVDGRFPPTIIVHGTKDENVPFSQSEDLAAALKASDVKHQLLPIPGAPHTPTDHMARILDAVSTFVSSVLAER